MYGIEKTIIKQAMTDEIKSKNPLVSVIIPVYNVEDYLNNCMKSVLSQSYSHLEIILVDDGSTDASGKMCDEYALKDSRVKVIHKINGGLSSARNAGTKKMTGSFFMFVDSDDCIHTDCISTLYDHLREDGSALAICSARKFYSKTAPVITNDKEIRHHVFCKEDALARALSRKIPMYAHGKLFSRSLSEFITFPEGRLFEDVPTMWHVLKHADRVSYTPQELYYYRQRPSSIVNANYNHQRMDQLYFSEQILSEIRESDPLFNSAKSRCFFAAADTYSLVTRDYPEDIAYLRKSIRDNRDGVLKDRHAAMMLKIMALLSYLNIGFVRMAGRIYKAHRSA